MLRTPGDIDLRLVQEVDISDRQAHQELDRCAPMTSAAWIAVALHTENGIPVLTVSGEADFATAPLLRARLLEVLPAHVTGLVVDLSQLRFCDLLGLDALDDARIAAAEAGVSLTYRGMSPQLAWLHETFPRQASGS